MYSYVLYWYLINNYVVFNDNSHLIKLVLFFIFKALPLPVTMANPFAGVSQIPIQGAGAQPQNFFQQQVPPRPSINQIRQQPVFGSDPLPSPLVPAANPFLS